MYIIVSKQVIELMCDWLHTPVSCVLHHKVVLSVMSDKLHCKHKSTVQQNIRLSQHTDRCSASVTYSNATSINSRLQANTILSKSLFIIWEFLLRVLQLQHKFLRFAVTMNIGELLELQEGALKWTSAVNNLIPVSDKSIFMTNWTLGQLHALLSLQAC